MTPAAGRALICAHSHPAISKGGAEIAAWSLFEGVQAAGRDAWFMGCVSEPAARLGSAITQPFGARQFLYAAGAFDWFKFANQDASFPRQFGEVLTELRPDLVHFHHYVNFGLESFLHIRRVLPNCKIVLTLHEYQAICNHYGQMITRQRKSLCYGASPRDCNRCFPEFSQADFFLRRAYAMRFFDLVDQFIAPSRFLAERYVKWGLPEARMAVIENVTAEVASAPPAPPPPSKVLRIGFFGQISLLKGIHVLLDAARLLEEAGATGIAFDIHGDHTNQPAEFQSDFLARLETAGSNVRFHGAYDNARVDHLMRGVDAVLVPSIWWE
ncbi:MAG: glycosyltransferase, partial [Rhodospirillales bacterium]|nr:glycosyltransferase [Rhodospirillales bacterium]